MGEALREERMSLEYHCGLTMQKTAQLSLVGLGMVSEMFLADIYFPLAISKNTVTSKDII